MVGKLAPNSTHFTRGLVKYIPGRGYFGAVPSQNGDKFVTSSSPPPIVERLPPMNSVTESSPPTPQSYHSGFLVFDVKVHPLKDATGQKCAVYSLQRCSLYDSLQPTVYGVQGAVYNFFMLSIRCALPTIHSMCQQCTGGACVCV